MARGDNKDTMGTQGVDWEWRTAKGTNVKTRHRFTAAERAAMAPKPAAKPKATTTASTKSAPAAKSTSVGDSRTAPAKVYSGRGDAPYTKKPAITGTASASAGTASATQKKDIRTGKAEAIAPVSAKLTGTRAKAALEERWAKADANAPAGMSFSEWKNQYAGKTWKPGEALAAYGVYKNKSTSSYAKGGMVTKKGKC